MFGVGWTEMLVIGIVALVVIGPKDLPVVMNRLGKVVANIRRMGNEFQRELNKTTGLNQITDLRRSITEPLRQTAAEITREFNRPTMSGKVEPTGVIAPSDPAVEDVSGAIKEKLGMTPAAATPLVPPLAEARPIESPAPLEAIAPKPAPKPRKPRAKKIVPPAGAPVVAAPVVSVESSDSAAATKPPRRRRTTKPATEA